MHEAPRGPVGDVAEHLITNIRDEQGNLAAGNVLRRLCLMFGKEACADGCQLAERCEKADDDEAIQEVALLAMRNRKSCADQNVADILSDEQLLNKNVLIVGVTANNVGFGDKIEEYRAGGALVDHSKGWMELPGFNAFFARTNEVDALGRRMADCADINFEFKDADGNTVIGFEHGTRENMFGEGEYRFERDGKKVSFTEYVIGQAIEHYGADPSTIKIKLAAAIKGNNFIKYFKGRENMEEHIPGWYDAGYLINLTNPGWREGDEIIKSDAWEADSRGMILDNIRKAMEVFNIPEENFSAEGIIDPADTNGVHSSHEFREKYGASRDLYLTYVREQ